MHWLEGAPRGPHTTQLWEAVPPPAGPCHPSASAPLSPPHPAGSSQGSKSLLPSLPHGPARCHGVSTGTLTPRHLRCNLQDARRPLSPGGLPGSRRGHDPFASSQHRFPYSRDPKCVSAACLAPCAARAGRERCSSCHQPHAPGGLLSWPGPVGALVHPWVFLAVGVFWELTEDRF